MSREAIVKLQSTEVDYKKEVSGSFASSGRVFVLGAGASLFAGYPLAAGLLSFIRGFRSLEATTREAVSRVLEKLSDAESQFTRRIVRDPNGAANLEELLTYLELYRSFPGTAFESNPWTSADSDAARRGITDRFLYYQHDLSASVWGAGVAVEKIPADLSLVEKVANAWGTLVKPGDVILTFNWDILHEVILWRAGLWSYRNGYGFQPGEQGDLEKSTQVLLLKLHGSVNWVQGSEQESVSEIANAADFFPGSKDWQSRPHYNQAQTDSGRKLVLPTYLKDISSNVVLLDLWTQAHQMISRATELVVVGYSLHPVDHPARHLFGIALRNNSTLDEITVVSPVSTHWGTFLSNAKKKLVPVRKRFEEWVCGG